jgi:polyphosphate kinase
MLRAPQCSGGRYNGPMTTADPIIPVPRHPDMDAVRPGAAPTDAPAKPRDIIPGLAPAADGTPALPPPPPATPPAPADLPTDPGALFFNRDISWLDFNRRVLHEAADPRTPLLERVKFLAIFSTNSDEFFMKRIGLIKRKIAEKSKDFTNDGQTWEKHLQRVRDYLLTSSDRAVDLWTHEIRPALEQQRIFIRDYEDLSPEDQAGAATYYRQQIFPVLTPLAVDPGHPFPFISNLSVSIGALLKAPGNPEHLFARIKVPQLLSRWYRIDRAGQTIFVSIESLIESNLESLFPGMEIVEHQHFRVTRNAEVEADMELEDADDLLELVQEELRARRFADTVRVQITREMSTEMRQWLIDGLACSESDLYEIPEPLGKVDLMAIAELRRPDTGALESPRWQPQITPSLADPETDIFAQIRQHDILLHHPYESFDSSVERFIIRAVADPRVLAIKMTLYRTSGDSPFVSALARAAENGKQVAVLIELKARFDEERNIQWAQALEAAGAHVVYGVLGLKTHAKTALVVRREDDRLRCYCHISTGNYNSKTAQLYTDVGLLTANETIANDVVDFFASLTGRSLKRTYQKLLVAPGMMRKQWIELIEREADNARAGRPSRIIAKMNGLEDHEIIMALYRASNAGVPIDLIVRGICGLRPQTPGLSENIRVTSIVGHLLEHSRLFYFQNGETPAYYISSADWMSRNLSSRIETAVPIEQPGLQARLKQMFDLMLADNRQSWRLNADGTWTQQQPGDQPPLSSQQRLMELSQQAARQAMPPGVTPPR